MATENAKPKVMISRCTEYDVDRIAEIAQQGMEWMELRPHGKTILKPNLVIAHDKYFKHAYTRVEVAEGVLRAARARAEELESIRIAERCGITMPTRLSFAQAGYYDLARREDVELVSMDEVTQVEVQLAHPDRLRDYVFTPQCIADCDFMINLPKYKAHPWTLVTFALKNWIGIQDDRHRMIDHDYHLDQKIADLQEVCQQDLIVIDAIVAGQDRMLTAVPFDMGLIIMGNNPVAIDAVSCQILGLDPMEVDHIRLCHERGLGPVDMDAIELGGDVELEQARRLAKGFRKGLIRVEDYFEGTPITAYAGPPGKDADCDYCWGGCPGAMEEAIEIIRTTDPKTDETMKPMHVVFGRYDGPINAKPGEKVVFIGDCTTWKGELDGKQVESVNEYQPMKHKDPHHARFLDIMLKMVAVFINVFRHWGKPQVRVRGCPVSVAEQVLYISRCGRTKNPYFDPAVVVPFAFAYMAYWSVRIFRRLTGRRYQRAARGRELPR